MLAVRAPSAAPELQCIVQYNAIHSLTSAGLKRCYEEFRNDDLGGCAVEYKTSGSS